MGIKIIDLTAAGSIKASDVLPISQDDGLGGRNTLKVNMQQVAAYVTSGVAVGITSVGIISDGSLEITGSPLVDNGNIHVALSSVSLDKISNVGATDGDVLKYNGATSTWIANSPESGFRNRLINGDMRIWQRGTSFTGIGADTYTVDRWTTSTSTATLNKNITQQTLSSSELPATDAGIVYYARLNFTSGNNVSEIAFQQAIELTTTGKISPFALNQQYTLSFYARSESAGTSYWNALYADSASNINPVFINSDTDINLTTSWAKFSYTFDLNVTPASSNNALMIVFKNGLIGANTNIDITGIQIEKGTTATSFEFRPYGTELALCQRYYMHSSNSFTVDSYGTFQEGVDSGPNVVITFPVTMRTTPVVTFSETYINGNNSGTVYTNIHGFSRRRCYSAEGSGNIRLTINSYQATAEL